MKFLSLKMILSEKRLLRIPKVLMVATGLVFYAALTWFNYSVRGYAGALDFFIIIVVSQFLVFIVFDKVLLKKFLKDYPTGKEKFIIKSTMLALGGLILTNITDYLLINEDGVSYLFQSIFWISIVIIGMLLIYTIERVENYAYSEINESKKAEERMKSELRLIKNQINPHFLFNTLNNIYGLVHMHDSRAEEMIAKLSNILRYLIYECSASRVSLRKEQELIEEYIQLQFLKSNELSNKVDFYSDGVRDSHKILPTMLINFVENCFKHSDIETVKGGWIKVSLEVVDNQLTFMTRNTIKKNAESAKDGGIGLKNTKELLKREYDNHHSLDIKVEDNIYCIDLKLDLI